jgi:spore germination protein GerM
MTRRHRRLTVVAVSTVFALTGAGCGINTDDTPHRADPADVPFGLLNTALTTSPTPSVPATEPASVYFVRDDHLVPLTRRVASPASANKRLMSLARGPDQAESAGGIRTALPSGDLIGNVRQGGGAVQIELTATLGDLSPEEQLLLIGQIVLTAAGPDTTTRVTFSREGEPVTVPRPLAEPSSAPVTPSAYRALLAG